MYYPVNWPKLVRVPALGDGGRPEDVDAEPRRLCQVTCNRDKILIAVLTPDSLVIFFNQVTLSPLLFPR